MSASLESRCPSCHREFANDSRVLQHMNNPRSSCQSWSEFLLSLGQTGHTPTSHPPNPETNDNETAGGGPPITHYEDVHPNTPSVFGSSQGFMGVFDADPHAEERVGNLYYPFLSRDEWSLASWLSCSGLSMRAINGFLALPVVSIQIICTLFLANENQDSTAFALVRNRENTTYSHGLPSQGP